MRAGRHLRGSTPIGALPLPRIHGFPRVRSDIDVRSVRRSGCFEHRAGLPRDATWSLTDRELMDVSALERYSRRGVCHQPGPTTAALLGGSARSQGDRVGDRVQLAIDGRVEGREGKREHRNSRTAIAAPATTGVDRTGSDAATGGVTGSRRRPSRTLVPRSGP